MRSKWITNILRILFFVVCTTLMSFHFYKNSFGIAEEKWFKNHQRDTEAHVVGRMVIARSHGFMSYGGLTGVGLDQEPDLSKRRGWYSGKAAAKQYAQYLSDGEFPFFSPYMSQPGWQALTFTAFDRMLPMSSDAKLRFFHVSTSILTSAALAALCLWIVLEFGWTAGVLAMLSVLASQWLCVFGRNLWWVTWSFFLPIVSLLFVLLLGLSSKWKYGVLMLTVFASFFIKCMATGYEYMTTTCIMGALPLVYYHVKQWPGWRRFLLHWCMTPCMALFAIALSMVILCFQIGSVRGSFSDGVDHIAYSFRKRNYSKVEASPQRRRPRRRPEPKTLDVWRKYHDGVFVYRNAIPGLRNPDETHKTRPVKYSDLMKLFGWASGAALLLLCVPMKRIRKRLILAAVVALWFGLLAPYSWFVVFRKHSMHHHHMNYLLWQMPFTIFGFALIGLVIEEVVRLVPLDRFRLCAALEDSVAALEDPSTRAYGAQCGACSGNAVPPGEEMEGREGRVTSHEGHKATKGRGQGKEDRG